MERDEIIEPLNGSKDGERPEREAAGSHEGGWLQTLFPIVLPLSLLFFVAFVVIGIWLGNR